MITADVEPPGDRHATAALANPGLMRALKFAVVAMALLLLAGLAAVAYRIIYLAKQSAAQPAHLAAPVSAPPTGAIAPEADLGLPEGAVVRSMSMSGNRLAVHYEAPAESGIAIVDLETGRALTRVRIRPEAAPR